MWLIQLARPSHERCKAPFSRYKSALQSWTRGDHALPLTGGQSNLATVQRGNMKHLPLYSAYEQGMYDLSYPTYRT